ncbi:MAG: VOC family protein, partial [Bdellovibrionia bacterium]
MLQLVRRGFDHVEFVVHELGPMESVFQRMGFEKIGSRHLKTQGTQSVVYAQGDVRVMLTQPDPTAPRERSSSSEALKFLSQHAPGICVLALEVQNAQQAYEDCLKRGARSARAPQVFESAQGRVVRAEVWTPGDFRYAFIERHSQHGSFDQPALFDEQLEVLRLRSPSPLGIECIDHLTNNVGIGDMKSCVQNYQE